jgi:ribosomal protein S18 acetylase RimI-like enzyme
VTAPSAVRHPTTGTAQAAPFMLGFKVRRVTLDGRDIDRLAPLFDLYRQFYEQPADLARARRFLCGRLRRAESVIFAAVPCDSRASHRQAFWGFVQLYAGFSSIATSRTWTLNDLFVRPDRRRVGVGRALLDRAARHARSSGAVRLTLETRTSNTNAQALYESVGYRCENTTVRFYVLDLESARPRTNPPRRSLR